MGAAGEHSCSMRSVTPDRPTVLKKLLHGIAGIALLSLCAFFVLIVLYVAQSEILPALREGTFDIETRIMILNIVWDGNELYVLLAAYLLLAAGFAYGAFRAFRAATRSNQ